MNTKIDVPVPTTTTTTLTPSLSRRTQSLQSTVPPVGKYKKLVRTPGILPYSVYSVETFERKTFAIEPKYGESDESVIDVYNTSKKRKLENDVDSNYVLSTKTKRQILNTKVPYPVCEYHPDSRRNATEISVSELRIRMDDHLLRLKTLFSEADEIFIDGITGTGKTTLAKALPTRNYFKINKLLPNVTSGSKYNYQPLLGFEYLMYQILSIPTPGQRIVWDRHPFANLCFYLVHHLQSVYGNRTMPKTPYDAEISAHCSQFAATTGLYNTLSLCLSIKKMRVLILLADPEYLAVSLLNRSHPNDVYNSKEHNYIIAQLHAYRFIGSLINAEFLDLSRLQKLYDESLTLSDVQRVLVDILDGRPDESDDDDEEEENEEEKDEEKEKYENGSKKIDGIVKKKIGRGDSDDDDDDDDKNIKRSRIKILLPFRIDEDILENQDSVMIYKYSNK